MPQPRIREYADSDEDAVLALWEAAGIGRPWLDLRAEIAQKLKRDRELFLVAEDAETRALVGAVMGAYDGRRGWVYHLAVQPDRQRQGLGRDLMAALEEAMLAAGVRKVNLQVRADNPRVVAFYEKLGYQDERLTSMGKRLRR